MLDAVKREIFEETGLQVGEQGRMRFIGVHTWEDHGEWAKFTFVVDVNGNGVMNLEETGIKLAPDEHEGAEWVGEGEVRKCLEEFGGEGVRKFISKENVEVALEAFRLFGNGQ